MACHRLPPTPDLAPYRFAVLLSGTGRTLENLLRACDDGRLPGQVAVVISSVPGVRGLAIAEAAGILTLTLPRQDSVSDQAYSDAIYTALAPYQVDLVLLAGFLRRLIVAPAYEGRILNIHPALLPETAAFAAGRGRYGERVHAAVLASGAMESGATVHVVDNGYDTGPVIARARVPILPGDTPATLGERVFAAECALYPIAIRRYLDERGQTIEDRRWCRPCDGGSERRGVIGAGKGESMRRGGWTGEQRLPLGIALARVVVGVVFVMHGWQKLVDNGIGATGDYFESLGIPVPTLMALVVTFVELLGGAALILGFLTRLAAVLLAVDMTVAFSVQHVENGFFVSNNGVELVLLLGVLCLVFLITGPGALALDAMMSRPRWRPRSRPEPAQPR